MDYKEKYEKALERAKNGLPIDEVFPELKESEDEKIRKNLIKLLLDTPAQDIISHHLELSKVLAYLEKQKDIDCLACDQHLKGYIAGRKVTEEEKQKEQVPAEWSEEDEKMARFIGNAITTDDASKYLEKKNIKIIDAHVWLEQKLKFLLPQPHWKPSEEQMNALWGATEKYLESDNEKVREIRGKVLESLYNDLEKQMEE